MHLIQLEIVLLELVMVFKIVILVFLSHWMEVEIILLESFLVIEEVSLWKEKKLNFLQIILVINALYR